MKKSLFLFVLALCFQSFAMASSSDSIQIPSDKASVMTLNGEWFFRFIDGNDWSGFSAFFNKGYDCSSWDRIEVPGCWDAIGYLPAEYAHPKDVNGLYKTSFSVPRAWKGKEVFLNFDGVLRAYDLWVNGEYVGNWELANNSCQFNVTPFVKAGKNELSMRVYTRYKGYEFDGNDDWGQVGIHRDITLFAVPKTHVKDLRIVTRVAPNDDAEVRLDIKMNIIKNVLNVIKGGRTVIKGKIVSPDMNLVDTFEYKVAGETVSHVWNASSPHLWTAETPSLYTLYYSVWQNGKLIESFSRKFGIREIRVEGSKLLLNNRLFKLRGVNIHATDPQKGKVISNNLNLKDMKLMKEANVNFIRTSHYPREPRFYDLCDSLGFYVMDEVPFGYGDEHLNDTTYQDNLILRARATVARDKNHPCVIVWSIGNENNLTPICQVTGKYVQQMDPTRPICYPMIGSYFNRFNFDLPDFLDIYAPHYPSAGTLRDYARRSSKPVIATEYCHTLGQALEDHHSMWEVMQANDNLAGGAIWEWVDQGMPDRESVWPGKYAWTDRVWLSETKAIKMEGNQGTDGLLYPTRDPLPNYYNIRKNYAQAYVLTDKIKADATHTNLSVELENRYDFVDLKDRVECCWQIKTADGKVLDSGKVSPACEPHQRCTLEIDAKASLSYLDETVCILDLRFTDKTNGLAVNEKSFILNSDEQYSSIVASLEKDIDSENSFLSFIIRDDLWRSGRKPSIAEDLILTKRGGSYVTNYIMEGGRTRSGDYCFSNNEISFCGTLNRTKDGSAVVYEFDMSPQTDGKLLTEAGFSLLLYSGLNCFQWLGRGPYTSYPGKDDANAVGVHALKAGDLYFEGNKTGVDALLCTDERGNGLLFLSDVHNVNFEETDQGIVVSFNPVVSGMGRKGQVTMFPQYSRKGMSISGEVRVIPVKAGKWSRSMRKTFRDPSTIQVYSPFISVYDTYLRKLEDIDSVPSTSISFINQ